VWVVAAAVLAAVPACRNKSSAENGGSSVTGLGAVPADAAAVISFDVRRLADSQLVERAVALLLQREPSLGPRWERLAAACKLDLGNQIERVLLAIAPATKDAPQRVLIVAMGDLPEKTVSTCVQDALGAGGGKVVADKALYQASEGSREVWFGYGRADTLVLGSNRAWVEAALGKGPKLATEGALKPLLARADQAAPIWAAGRPGPVGEGLIRVTQGRMKQGPQALFVSLDPTTGLRFELGVELASEDDAKVLEEFTKIQLPTLAMAAQVLSLGPLVAKITPAREGSTVKLRLSLGMDEVNQLLVAIDRTPPDPQGSAPPSLPAQPDAAPAAPAGKP
jgi:hypothetical protein